MPSAFDDAFEQFTAPHFDAHFGVQVVYVRNASESAETTATWEMQEYQVFDRDGFATQVQSRDFILAAADLVVGGETITPRPGDVIREAESGQEYEVMPLGSKPAADLLLGDHRWLIHTKRVA